MPGYASFAVDLPDQQTLEGMLCVFAKETFVANLLEVQETKCSFSTAERNRKSFRWTQVREWKAYHHYQRWMAFRKLSHHMTMMEETLCVIATRRHYHSHADKHMACDMVDNVPPSVPVSSCLSKLYHLRRQ